MATLAVLFEQSYRAMVVDVEMVDFFQAGLFCAGFFAVAISARLLAHIEQGGASGDFQYASDLISLIKEHGEFVGSASELVEQLDGIDCPKNRITSILNMNVIALHNSHNIIYSYKRTNSKRIINLKQVENSDTETIQ